MYTLLKKTLIAPLCLLLLSLSGCEKEEITSYPQPAAVLQEKTVNFNIYGDEDYSSAQWNNAKVQVRVTIRKVGLEPYKETVVLDSTLDWIDFKDVPAFENRILVNQKLSYDPQKESIAIGYSRVYDVDGLISTSGVSYYLERDLSENNIDIIL
ncbi:hypothetical protein [Pontibacter sp. SGAir0037]|uniref:hypothetical protein n=1 Tax=Pontibacter sp. SGAir0037 TaxID=2571030 RepID=UPI0010CD5AB2|nr:hypothetical protein [Pontibacter sp. SGAir0037]QCR21091.1 hypothetical protein C1N53_01060 [Pontibacter sp. SGAir0037]